MEENGKTIKIVNIPYEMIEEIFESKVEPLIKKINNLESKFSQIIIDQNETDEDILNIDEVVKLTGYSKKYVYYLSHQDNIPHYKRSRRVFFKRGEIVSWMLEKSIPSNI